MNTVCLCVFAYSLVVLFVILPVLWALPDLNKDLLIL